MKTKSNNTQGNNTHDDFWNSSIEGKCVKTLTNKEIRYIEDLRDYINEDKEGYPKDVEDICEAMGWIIPTQNVEFDIAVDLEHNQLLQISEGPGDDSCEVVNPFDTGRLNGKYQFVIVVSRDNGDCFVESLHEDLDSVEMYIESRWPNVVGTDTTEKPDTWIRIFNLEKTYYVAYSKEDLPFYEDKKLLEYAECKFAEDELGGKYAGFIEQARVDAMVCNFEDLGMI